MDLEQQRRAFLLDIPEILNNVCARFVEKRGVEQDATIGKLFPNTRNQPVLQLEEGNKTNRALRIGVVFSGGQAPGGHNVIAGLFDTMKKMHSSSELFGFLEGPDGILSNKQILITQKIVDAYRNQGGFDLIGSGRTKIEYPEDRKQALATCNDLQLDGLVIIGGDDSNTNAMILAEDFAKNKSNTVVIGVPKTIDGDLQSVDIPISFGFDTATKTYAELIGNIAKDALSAKKYYHFIRLMGRSASHVTLECALRTHPNLTFLSEDCLAKNTSLLEIVDEIVDLVEKRASLDRSYGVILIPEGLLEFIPEMKSLIQSINEQLAKKESQDPFTFLQGVQKNLFSTLPTMIQEQLLLDRDPHGNVQVSKIETEKLLIAMVKKKLEERKKCKKSFHAVPHFFGYEGRAGFPSNFDASYCYCLGAIASFLVREKRSGYMACCGSLHLDQKQWVPQAIPMTMLMNIERRKGEDKPVIKKALVDSKAEAYRLFVEKKEDWKWSDDYQMPGPIQFFGPKELSCKGPVTLRKNTPIH